jgi:hypothetical protein
MRAFRTERKSTRLQQVVDGAQVHFAQLNKLFTVLHCTGNGSNPQHCISNKPLTSKHKMTLR